MLHKRYSNKMSNTLPNIFYLSVDQSLVNFKLPFAFVCVETLIFSAGGHGLVPVSWKRYWCVIKNGQLYCFKTSFDAAADYCFPLKCYELEIAVEKRKNRFVVCVYKLQPFQICSNYSLRSLNGVCL